MPRPGSNVRLSSSAPELSAPVTPLDPSTKTQILDVAERLFAEQGFAATSLRALTAAAGVNLAAVNYHFGSKEALLLAVFDRRLRPLNERRIASIDALVRQAAAAGLAPSLEGLLDTLFRPVLEMTAEPGGEACARLFARVHLETEAEALESMFLTQFCAVRDRMLPALKQTLPELDEDELLWRLHFAIGALAHTMQSTIRLKWLARGRAIETDRETTLRRLIEFCAAGMRAGAPSRPPEGT